MDYLSQRREAIAHATKQKELDALLVTHPANVTYLTGFTGDSSSLVIAGKQLILVSDTRFQQQIEEACPGLDVFIRSHDRTTPEAAVDVLAKTGARAVGLEADHTSLALAEMLRTSLPKVSFAPAAGLVEALRAVKDPAEVEHIRNAVRAAERAFGMFRALLRETDTEKDMADALEGYVRRAGAKGSPFPVIVAVGDRGALPHAIPSDRLILDGSKVIVDWGADLVYKADITRTFRSPFSGTPTRKNKQERTGHPFEEIFEVVCRAQDAAVGAVRHGVPAKDVDAAARKVITDAGYGEYFTHGLGHGLGLEVHEAPRVRANSTDTLAVGNVITIEPGIYIPDWGGVRVEDDYLVTKDGAIRLTTLPRDPAAIG